MPDSVSAEAMVAMAARWPRRYTVIILFALSTVLCYIDRVNISIAIIPLAHAKGYSDAERGLILSSFFWGYLWFQLPGGLLADRFGGKRVLGAGVALWSIATFLTPIATASFGLLLFMRAALGAGEAVNFPAIHSIAARWTPASERARHLAAPKRHRARHDHRPARESADNNRLRMGSGVLRIGAHRTFVARDVVVESGRLARALARGERL